tara:strand:- start:969 stop:1550 length:582 start_codon:yes stop_codon:yes gene_type:complete
MCNPTLAIAGAQAVLQFQVANAQQKAIRDQQIRQNEIAMRNREQAIVSKTRGLIQRTKGRLEKIGEAEKISRRKRATFKVNRENVTGNSYDFLLANYYDKEANYRNRILGNIASSKFQYLQDLKAVDLRYDSQSTYVSPVDRNMNFASSALSFGSTYYNYKAKQNRFQTNNERYGYGDFTGDTDIFSDSGFQY